MKWRSFHLLGLVLASIFFLAGCGDYQKLNDRAQVMGIGLDEIEGHPDRLKFTFQIPNLESSSATSSTGIGEKEAAEALPYRNFAAEATSLESALSKVQTAYHKAFFLGNMKAIVIHTGLSSDQVSQSIEQLMRDETIDKMSIVTASKVPAEVLLGQKTSSPPSQIIESMYETTVPQRGYTAPQRLWEFWRDAETVGLQPHLPLVSPIGNSLIVGGTLIFSHYQPACIIDEDQTVFFTMLSYNVRGLATTIPDGSKWFDIKNEATRKNIWVTLQNNRPVLHARVRVNTELSSDETHGNAPMTSIERQRYERVMDAYIEDQLKTLIQSLQKRGTDAFGFGRRFVTRHPEHLDAIQHQWNELFANAKLDIQVRASISRKGNLL